MQQAWISSRAGILPTKPHYDMHYYYDPVEIREKRTCDKYLETPVCDFTEEQSTAAGRAFFNVRVTRAN